MNSKRTLFWGVIAVALFAFIFFFERNLKKPVSGPLRILSALRPEAITAVVITPANHLPIKVARTNASWHISEPIPYAAQSDHIEAFIAALTNLVSSPPITPAELRDRSRADEEFGFVTPQATALLYWGDQAVQILFGARTAPGDQIFLRVMGLENIFIVDAGIMDLLPRSEDDWRDRSFVDLSRVHFDHLTVLNAGTAVEFKQDTNSHWKMTRPMQTMQTRVDDEKFYDILRQLPELRVVQFASDHARSELDTFGLQPPDIELNFSQGSNSVLSLQFGKSLTNDAPLAYARLDSRDTVVVVSNAVLSTWRTAFDTLRDRHLLSAGTLVGAIEIHGTDDFTILPQTNGIWTVQPQNFIVDSNLMAALLVNLNTMQVTQFVKDVVTEGDLPPYGLASPTARLIIHSGDGTNSPSVQINFGTTQEGQIYAKRMDEDSVYSIAVSDLSNIPALSWQIRNRQVWKFDAEDVTNIVVSEAGHERQIRRTGEHDWALAPGSQGIIQDLAIDQLVTRFADLTVAVWSARAPTNLATFGFKDGGEKLAFELKGGEKYQLAFGGPAPSQFPYAAVTFNGEQWVFEFPWDLYQLVHVYISIPKVVP